MAPPPQLHSPSHTTVITKLILNIVMQLVAMRHGGVLCFCLLALLAMGGVWAQSSVMRHQGGGHTLVQAPDGSWVQSVTLRGVALPGLAGLRHAFTRQGVEITCPSSLVRWGGLLLLLLLLLLPPPPLPPPPLPPPGRHRALSRKGPPACPDVQTRPILQVFSVGMDSEKSSGDDGHRTASATVAWSMRKRCGPLGSLHAPTTTAEAGEGPGTCHVEAPAVGTTVLTVVQPPSPPGGMAGAGPDPCTLTVTPVFSSTLVATCLLGAYLLLHGQSLMRGRLAVALLNASTTVIPLVSALVSVALLASMAVLSTAMVEMVLKLIPYDLPKCARPPALCGGVLGVVVVTVGVWGSVGACGVEPCSSGRRVRCRPMQICPCPPSCLPARPQGDVGHHGGRHRFVRGVSKAKERRTPQKTPSPSPAAAAGPLARWRE